MPERRPGGFPPPDPRGYCPTENAGQPHVPSALAERLDGRGSGAMRFATFAKPPYAAASPALRRGALSCRPTAASAMEQSPRHHVAPSIGGRTPQPYLMPRHSAARAGRRPRSLAGGSADMAGLPRHRAAARPEHHPPDDGPATHDMPRPLAPGLFGQMQRDRNPDAVRRGEGARWIASELRGVQRCDFGNLEIADALSPLSEMNKLTIGKPLATRKKSDHSFMSRGRKPTRKCPSRKRAALFW